MAPTARVALATTSAFAHYDVDLPHMLDALNGRGIHAAAVSWDDADTDWSTFDLVAMRSTWDYCERLDEFLAWTAHVGQVSALANPPDAVRWNCDKRYLQALGGRGIPVLRTFYLVPGEDATLPDLADFVVKPVVSAGALSTARYTRDQRNAAVRHVELLHGAGMTVMVQPYLPQIAEGERALVFLDGRFSHAIRKGPLLVETGVIDDERMPHPDPARYAPTEAELALARRALDASPVAHGKSLYARVDTAVDAHGHPVLMELELIEPNLFLGWSDGAVARFADAVARRLTPS